MDAFTATLVFPGSSEMARRMREFDWADTPLGPAERWPQALKTVVRILLMSRQPMWIGWGKELTYLYNDPYKSIIGGKHPHALGQPTTAVWGEIWDDIGPLLATALDGNEGIYVEEQLLIMERNGYREETYYTFSYSPIADDDGLIGGILCANTDDTERVIGERRLALLRDLAARTTEARTWREACDRGVDALATNPRDLPFALLYMVDSDGQGVKRAGACGIDVGHPAAPETVSLDAPSAWPFAQALAARDAFPIVDLHRLFDKDAPRGSWHFAPTHAAALPIHPAGEQGRRGVLIVGLNPLRPFDESYRSFLTLVARQIGASIANADAYEEEKRRAEALAEIDRAKTLFFTNISHEFRTPLTLMLGPLEDMLAKPPEGVLPENRELMQIIHRHALRLLKLVNTLLDFSRIEGGRMRAVYVPTDLASVTRDLASQFQSAVENAGLRLSVQCEAIDEPVYVDRDMWEKIVLNLLSNAFKFTFEGEIEVRLRRRGASIELAVRDTGVGIPAADLAHVFERFHRVEGAKRRSHEGTGIGLALVHELAGLHGGVARVESIEGRGSTFTVSLPLGSAHLPPEQIGAAADAKSTALPPDVFVDEAMRWLPGAPPSISLPPGDECTVARSSSDAKRAAGGQRNGGASASGARPRIVLADDNADMREYVRRLLAECFEVEAVADGAAALAAIRRHRPDLVLTDVMMPEMDGFQLLERLRGEQSLRDLPVIVLSARAGEEARIEGAQAGADDYVVKPFSSRELLARVTTHLELSRIRRQASETVRQGEERLRMALDAARMVAWQWTPSADRVSTSANAEDIFGLRQLESMEQAFAAVHPDDVGRVRATINGVLERGGGFECQFRLVRPSDGAVVWLEARGNLLRGDAGAPARLAGVTTDVTARKWAEDALAADKNLLQRIIAGASLKDVLEELTRETESQSSDGMLCSVLVADESGKRLWHGAAPSLPEEYNRAIDGLVIGPAVGSCGTAAFERRPVFVNDIAHDPLWERYRDLALAHGLAACCSTPIFDGEGLLLGTMAMYYSVPREPSHRDRQLIEHATRLAGVALARDRAEQLIRESQEQLREADRRKDEFLATLAHELRNPLAPLRQGLQLLRMSNDVGPDAKAIEEMMERQVHHMVRLVDDLMEVSRITRGKIDLCKERLDLAAVIGRAVETSKPLIDAASHELTMKLPDEPLTVEADAVRIAQVLTNLLNNAAKYTLPGGRIWLNAKREGDTAVVSVRDNGMGIPREMLPKVFQMFTQIDRDLKRAQGGLGIGLTLVKSLMEMHDGSVEVASEGQARGSEFTIRLPLAPHVEPPPAPHPSNGQPVIKQSSRRILVVDDNRDSAESLGMLLRISGDEVHIAHDGPSALDAAAAFRPDVAVLDIGMPGMSGYELARALRLRRDLDRLILIAMTGWGTAEDRRRTQDAGFHAHLVKPVAFQDLKTLLTSLG